MVDVVFTFMDRVNRLVGELKKTAFVCPERGKSLKSSSVESCFGLSIFYDNGV